MSFKSVDEHNAIIMSLKVRCRAAGPRIWTYSTMGFCPSAGVVKPRDLNFFFVVFALLGAC